jgi:hypothetical protein
MTKMAINGLLLAMSLCLVVACGGDDASAPQAPAGQAGSSQSGSGGNGGSNAAGGNNAGAGGNGTSGTAGTSGSAGNGGNSTAGASGSSGTAGSGGAKPQGKPIFIAVGDGGRRASTVDGKTWDDQIVSGGIDHTPDLLRGVGYGDGMFVAVGGDANSMIMTTSDGVTWNVDVVKGIEGVDQGFLSGVAWYQGVWVAAGGAGHIVRSMDKGKTWEATGKYYDGHFRGIAAGNGKFVAVGGQWNTNQGISSTSTDGKQWTPIVVEGAAYSRVVFGNNLFMANSTERCAVSADGLTWDSCGLQESNYGALAYLNGQFVQSYSGGYATSSDGKTWDKHQGFTPDSLAYYNGLYVGTAWEGRAYATQLGMWMNTNVSGKPLREIAAGEVFTQ